MACRWVGIAIAALGLGGVPAAEPTWHRQIWVPSTELETVLGKLSDPVSLTPGEYETLVREAAARESEAGVPAPREVVLRRLVMTGQIREDVLVIEAAYQWENLAGGTVSVSLPMPHRDLAALPPGENAVEVREATEPGGAARVILRGKGRRELTARFHLPVIRSEDGFEVRLEAMQVASASLQIGFERGMEVSSNGPVFAETGGRHLFGMPSGGEGLVIRWHRSGNDAEVPVAVRQTSRNLYFLDESGLQADLGIRLTAELSGFPEALRFALPTGTQVVDVSGRAVTDWSAEDGKLEIALAAETASPVDLRVLLERAVLPDGKEAATLQLPMLRAQIATRMEGRLSLFAGPGIRVEGMKLPGWFFHAPTELEAAEKDPACLAVVEFPVWNGSAPEIRVRRFAPRVQAAVDSLASVAADAVRLRHDVAVEVLEGEVFTSRIHLGAGEVLEEVEFTGSESGRWQEVGNEVRLQWDGGLTTGRPGRVRLRTRLHADVWSSAKESARVLMTGVLVDGASRSANLVLQASPDCRLTVLREEGLRGQDPRRTPMEGQLAWQGSASSLLELEISRLRAAFDAHLTAFAVPDAKKLEVEGQIDLAIRRSALREVEFAFAPEVAGAVRFSSPMIAGQWADLASGLVTVRFHNDLTGFQQLRLRMTLPVEPQQEGNEIRFSVPLPEINAPKASRVTGQWMIEARNDTSLTVKATQAKEFDTLRVPTIAGYVPSFRVVAAFDQRGAEHGIAVQGLQHVNRPVPGVVVERMSVDTYLSAEGRELHETELRMENRGAGEVLVGIPGYAEMLALEVDGASQRPVLAEGEGSPGGRKLRIVLGRSGEVVVRLSYVHGGQPWNGSGDLVVSPPRLEAQVPVEAAEWRLHLPEGYRYDRFSGGLPALFPEEPGVLLPLLWSRLAPHFEKSFGWATASRQSDEVQAAGGLSNRTLGATFGFRGERMPQDLTFRYTSSEEALRAAWGWILGGMISFWVLASFRPVVTGLTGVALLTFLPLSGLTDLIGVANGLLVGWLLMFAGSQSWRGLSVWTRTMGTRELPAQ
jgi:hypothetical protein